MIIQGTIEGRSVVAGIGVGRSDRSNITSIDVAPAHPSGGSWHVDRLELGHHDIVRLLTTNLNEEKAANTKLNTVALRKGVNRRAAS
jgi:hypothetical protein